MEDHLISLDNWILYADKLQTLKQEISNLTISDIISLSILVENCVHHWKMEALIYMRISALEFLCQVTNIACVVLMCEQCVSLYVVRKSIYQGSI